MFLRIQTLGVLAACLCLTAVATAEDKKKEGKPTTISLAGGKVSLTAPKAWEVKKPRSRIVDYEFAVPVVKEDKIPGRITVMGAGGSVKDNVDRWMGQFATKLEKATKVTKGKIDGAETHIVDITGTFLDSQGRGPFAGGTPVKRENYRMLGAIIVTDKLGKYFVKMYGPKATIDAQAKAFTKMVKAAKIDK